MEFSTTDYVKKSLMDTQARIREFMDYSDIVDGQELRDFFKNYAESEGRQAQIMRNWIEKVEDNKGNYHHSQEANPDRLNQEAVNDPARNPQLL